MARAMRRCVTSGSSASMSARSARHASGQLIGARRRFTEPERNARRLALGILDAHAARFDAQDAIRGVAELKDVAGQALDGEVLVERADENAGGSRITW
jgi:hypothetical protein